MEKYAFTCKRRDSPQMTILSKLLYKFNENSIKTPVIFFLRRRKTNYKTYKKGQNGRKKIFGRNNQGRLVHSYFQLCKYLRAKIMC
jgi:hypothetical protein